MHSVLSKCTDCEGLQHLYDKVECTILFMSKRKHQILIYNLEDKFDTEKFKSLIRYKRILSRRLRDCTYPNACIKNSDLIAIISQLAFKDESCSQCEDCFPDL